MSRAERIRWSSRNERSPSDVRSQLRTSQFGSTRSSEYGLDQALARRVLALLQVVDRHDLPLLDRPRQGRDAAPPRLPARGSGVWFSNWPNVSSSFCRTRSSGVCTWAAIVGPTMSSASRIARASSGVSRGRAEDVAVELLVDVDAVAVELGVDRVAAAAEVDEVEQREVILQLVPRDVEAARELVRVELGLVSPQAASRWASSACSTPKRSGATGGAGRSVPSAVLEDRLEAGEQARLRVRP